MRKLIFLFLILLATSCGEKKIETSKTVSTTILPFQFIVDRLMGDSLQSVCLLASGDNHGSYTMKVSQAKVLSKVKIHFSTGHLSFEEAWHEKIMAINPTLNYQTVNKGIEIIYEGGDGHKHEDGSSCGASGSDPHFWSSPKQMKTVVTNVYNVLKTSNLTNTDSLEIRYKKLFSQFDAIDKQFEEKLAKLENRTFLIFHPSLGYIARDYNLKQLAIEDKGNKPSPAHLKMFVDVARTTGVKAILIQKQYDQSSAMVIAREIGAKLVEINPLGYNYPYEAQRILNALTDNQ